MTRRSPGVRRAGYLIGALVNAALLYAVNVWPGWEVFGFLTDDMTEVLGLVNLSIVIGLVFYLAYVVRDPPWFRALGDLVAAAVGLAVLVSAWSVFPFDFSGGDADWEWLVRLALAAGILGCVVGIVAQVVTLVRLVWTAPGGGTSGG